MNYLLTHLDKAWALTVIHLRLSLIPVVLGLLIAVPLGAYVWRTTALRRLTTVTASIIFTIPSLALFVVLPLIIPTRILDEANVIVALTLYTTALLVRAVPEALDAVPAQVRDAATAVGYTRLARMLKVELPLSIPVLIAGLRVVAVTNISMVSVGSVIGIGGLGTWFTEGYQADKSDQIVAGIIAIFLLAIVIDVLILLAGRLITPWARAKACVMNFLHQALAYIFTAANWAGQAGSAARILEHLQYTAVAVVVSALIAIPIGMLIGHTGRGTFLVVTGVNALRALPTLGVLLLGVLLWGLGLLPPTVALMLLGHPAAAGGHLRGDRQRRPGGGRRRPLDGDDRDAGSAARRGAQRAAADSGWAAHRDAAGGRDRDRGRLRQPRRAGPLPDRRHQGPPVLPRPGGRAAGDGAGPDARRAAGAGGVGLGARHRADSAGRMPQPLLDDEVSFDAQAPRSRRKGRTSRPGYERGGPSLTVDG